MLLSSQIVKESFFYTPVFVAINTLIFAWLFADHQSSHKRAEMVKPVGTKSQLESKKFFSAASLREPLHYKQTFSSSDKTPTWISVQKRVMLQFVWYWSSMMRNQQEMGLQVFPTVAVKLSGPKSILHPIATPATTVDEFWYLFIQAQSSQQV